MNWRKVKRLNKEKSIEQVEEIFGVHFPDDFKTLIMKYNAGIPMPCTFDTERMMGKDFGQLLSFNLEDSFNILKEYALIKNRLHKKVYPFASDAGGNYLCFDFRENSNEPTVKFWDHEMKFEIANGELIVGESEYNANNYHLDFVSKNITELLSMLYGEEEDIEITTFSDDVLDIFIDSYSKEQILELEQDTVLQINKRMIDRNLPPIVIAPKGDKNTLK